LSTSCFFATQFAVFLKLNHVPSIMFSLPVKYLPATSFSYLTRNPAIQQLYRKLFTSNFIFTQNS